MHHQVENSPAPSESGAFILLVKRLRETDAMLEKKKA